MKNSQKGFIVPLLVVIIALLLASGTYMYMQKKQTTQVTPARPSVTVLSPNGGEVWQIGKTYDIKWSASGVPVVDIILGHFNLDNAANSNYREVYLAQGINVSNGIYPWTVPTTVIPGSNYSIRIEGGMVNEGKGARQYDDESNAPFTVTN